MNLRQLQHELGEAAGFSMKLKRLGYCISCKNKAADRCHSAEGRQEFRISGLCEICFDEMFEEDS